MSSQVAERAEAGSVREHKVRSARVWQPNEILLPMTPPEGFIAQPWRSAKNPEFILKDYSDSKLVLPAGDSPVPPDSPGRGGLPLETEPATAAEPGHSDAALQQAQAQGYARGVEETRLQMRSELEDQIRAELEADHALVQALQNAVTGLRQDPLTFFEPLKRLALHLAEQLVLGELRLNADAIDRLVQRCVDALAATPAAMIQVELNPLDMAHLESLQKRSGVTVNSSFHLVANLSLPIGSVRASADDAVVEDLIKHRLAKFARDLVLDQAQWQSDSAFASARTADA